MNSKTITDVLINNGMHPAAFDIQAEYEKFFEEMNDGLDADNDSSLLMLPTYISAFGEIPINKKIIVMDAGGTNFRVATAYFKNNGEAVFDYFKKYPMPGTDGEISAEMFFDTIAKHLSSVINKSDNICFCFSYPTEALPNKDGRLVAFCKEVKVRDAEGVEICAQVAKALRRAGVKDEKHFVLINDSVAALLGGKTGGSDQKAYSSYIGYILGTGVNACYIEQTKNINKIDGDTYEPDDMIINIESGVYTGFQQGTVDKMIDERSEAPGDHVFEKMHSGAYLGSVILETAKMAAREGCFSPEMCDRIGALDDLSLKDVNLFYSGLDESVLTDLLDGFEQDKAVMRQIIEALFERAAKLTAAVMAAIIKKTGKGTNPEAPVCICAEGTTFHKSELLRRYLDGYIKEFINNTLHLYVDIIKVEDATIVGTAVAGLLN